MVRLQLKNVRADALTTEIHHVVEIVDLKLAQLLTSGHGGADCSMALKLKKFIFKLVNTKFFAL